MSSSTNKETIGINTLITFRNSDQKIIDLSVQRVKHPQNEEVVQDQPVHMNIFQTDAQRKD